ncbi:NAD-dependent dihydropyrimidine dehydrogenase PreA subunit [Bradyrhizobium canariense]|nr:MULTISPECIES: ferredoxin family protein [Bradyrhizobium]MBM7488075.1 NAD-dependent dihydropyrimidine dehydrogenase PreA subunit [Bradyrhizobium canariense]MCS3765736.1 NAD-dependent dihydropyrimidine dehydrogenase PreA subunit [Bradyrhizobium centrosematis]MCS3777962.1 NAD-dependent dihydropyrimidine dehydrogenase PreA subunit [Bradyrhizobium centrosematis]
MNTGFAFADYDSVWKAMHGKLGTYGIPVIARQDDCQTCFLCELYCPEDALWVSPFADENKPVDVRALKRTARWAAIAELSAGPTRRGIAAASTGAIYSLVNELGCRRALST